MRAAVLSPLYLCILLLEETFVQAETLQQRVPGSSLSQGRQTTHLRVSTGSFFPLKSFRLLVCKVETSSDGKS